MRRLVFFIVTFSLCSLLTVSSHLSATTRGIRVVGKSGESLYLYKDYHALVVGVSDYDNWPDLPKAVEDAREVASVLSGFDFKVKLLLNPTSGELSTALNDMAFNMGSEKNRALLFYFAGHGETLELADSTQLGYIIPSDCPLKEKDPIGFDDKAISMKEIEILALKIKSKHLLMLFDSCFSGSLFDLVRAAPVGISERSAKPVRQFITAGAAGEEVPDRSVFKIVFLDGIKGYGDLNGDGYVTGSELGMYLQDKVVNYTRGRQHPQYGKINNPKLDKGDFIFLLASSAAGIEEPGRASLSVECNVSGARVLVDGREIGRSPVTAAALSPGDHQVRMEKEGYVPYQKRIHLETGRSLTLHVALSMARLRTGRVFVETEPEHAKVSILNTELEFYQGVELEPGRYHVEISAPGYETEQRSIDLAAGEDKYVTIRLAEIAVAPPAPAEETLTNSIGMTFVLIPAGTFMMGSPPGEMGRYDDEDQHRVTLTRPFYLQTTEVTQQQWTSVIGNNPSHFKDCGGNCPVERVSWNDCQEFIRKLNEREQTDKYRLPTEAEWEYACRAGANTPFYTGNCISTDRANYDGSKPLSGCPPSEYRKETVKVGSFPPNPWGLHDMSGNVWEWCEDKYGKYPTRSVADPQGPTLGEYRVLRGGCWDSEAALVRSADRISENPKCLDCDFGFRVARDY